MQNGTVRFYANSGANKMAHQTAGVGTVVVPRGMSSRFHDQTKWGNPMCTLTAFRVFLFLILANMDVG